ncbi:unnamed protein product, partial [Adineta ricciae]
MSRTIITAVLAFISISLVHTDLESQRSSQKRWNGQTAGTVTNCKIIKVLDDLFLHDCDAGRGSSGGPIFAYWGGKPYVYALNVAEYRNNGVDYQKAYDKVWHDGLIVKLRDLGIPINLLTMIVSWLNCREAYINLGENKSEKFNIDIGLPQGAHSGHLFADDLSVL